jgi:uncharacterized membrane protein
MTGSQVVRCLCFVSLVVGLSSGSSAGTIYTFTTIDVPGAISGDTLPLGINDAGQIVGRFADATGFHGFLKDATFATIDVPGATSTEGRGINNAGQIVGLFADATGFHSFLKDGATFTTFDVPGVGSGTQAHGINDAGQIVGSFPLSGSILHDGFLKDGATFTTIDVPGSGFFTIPMGSTTLARSWGPSRGLTGF